MKKIALILIALLLFTAVLSSCADRDYTDDGETETTATDMDAFLESVSAAISDGSYNPLVFIDPEVQFTAYDDYAEVTGCINAVGDVEIPAEYEGKPVTKIAAGAFEGLVSIKTILLPDSLVEIGDRAFLSCNGLTEIAIPDSVIKIGDNAFYGCSGLKTVNIGMGVTEIGSNAFGYCISLEEINVLNTNQQYTSEDGVLCSIDKATLICYPAGRTAESYTIFNNIKTIENFAFTYAQNLKSVTMTASVTSLGDYTFRSCAKLESVTLGTGLTFIGANTFDKCTALTSVTIPEGVKTIGYLNGNAEC